MFIQRYCCNFAVTGMKVIKRIDRHLVQSSIPPFIAAFFIAIFVLIMQFLWSFIDEIIGKGVSTLDLFELLFYRSLSLFPLALPIGVLLSSVMVFGNLSEKYELSSLKSAGVSLLRIMMPAVAFSVAVALFSVYCSNSLIPLTNLKFQSRLWDIRQQKPALSLEEGIFNDDFSDFTIRIADKDTDNRRIKDVLIYDQTSSTRRKFNMVTADRGEMYVSDDGRDFVMKLYDGYQYQEVESSGTQREHTFSRTSFKEWTKHFDMSEFDLNRTDEELFKSHHMMKSVRQLSYEIDTIAREYDKMLNRGIHDFGGVLDNQQVYRVEDPARDNSGKPPDSAPEEVREVLSSGARPASQNRRLATLEEVLDSIGRDADWSAVVAAIPSGTMQQFIDRSITSARSKRDNSMRLITTLSMIEVNKIKHIFELHWKFSIAMICVIFLFIGAPMGAIVRKGGYGYPLLVAIIFFTLFIIMNLMFKKLAESGAAHPVIAAWAPCLVLLPVSAFLTYKAMNDSKMLNVDKYLNIILKRLVKTT